MSQPDSARRLRAVKVRLIRAATQTGPLHADVAPLRRAMAAQTVNLRRPELVSLVGQEALLIAQLFRRLEEVEPGCTEAILEQIADPAAAMDRIVGV